LTPENKAAANAADGEAVDGPGERVGVMAGTIAAAMRLPAEVETPLRPLETLPRSADTGDGWGGAWAPPRSSAVMDIPFASNGLPDAWGDGVAAARTGVGANGGAAGRALAVACSGVITAAAAITDAPVSRASAGGATSTWSSSSPPNRASNRASSSTAVDTAVAVGACLACERDGGGWANAGSGGGGGGAAVTVVGTALPAYGAGPCGGSRGRCDT